MESFFAALARLGRAFRGEGFWGGLGIGGGTVLGTAISEDSAGVDDEAPVLDFALLRNWTMHGAT